jgi:amino acid transporter
VRYAFRVTTGRQTKSGLSAVPRRQLTLFDTTCIIVGIIIGAGFFESPPLIAAVGGSVPLLLGLWVAGRVRRRSVGAAVLRGARRRLPPGRRRVRVHLPRLRRPASGFLYAWAWFWVVRPGNLGAMAYVFARYANELVPCPAVYALAPWAEGALLVLTVVNVLGVRTGKSVQNLLTAAKVAGLLRVFARRTVLGARKRRLSDPPVGAARPLRVYLASILIMWVYGGMERHVVRRGRGTRPARNILRALVLGYARRRRLSTSSGNLRLRPRPRVRGLCQVRRGARGRACGCGIGAAGSRVH